MEDIRTSSDRKVQHKLILCVALAAINTARYGTGSGSDRVLAVASRLEDLVATAPGTAPRADLCWFDLKSEPQSELHLPRRSAGGEACNATHAGGDLCRVVIDREPRRRVVVWMLNTLNASKRNCRFHPS